MQVGTDLADRLGFLARALYKTCPYRLFPERFNLEESRKDVSARQAENF